MQLFIIEYSYQVVLVSLIQIVRYYFRQSAENTIRYISGTKLDDRIIRTDWDIGFIEGRQYGRGKSGGQVNHNLRFRVFKWPHPKAFSLFLFVSYIFM